MLRNRPSCFSQKQIADSVRICLYLKSSGVHVLRLSLGIPHCTSATCDSNWILSSYLHTFHSCLSMSCQNLF
jgi:hypothetical protein